ncbi:MAG: imidazole glycerol phosphate synthase subunit HisH [Hyphomonadaceae bacterium]
MGVTALIDYGSGNIRSVEKALAAAGADVRVTADPDAIRAAERIVLPGQGAFADCMNGLTARDGAIAALQERVIAGGAPFLGICVGMQLLATRGLEFGETPGLDWIAGVCRPLERRDPWIRIPHMGWNEARVVRAHPVFDALAPASHMYFMHSFVHQPADAHHIATETAHGEAFASAIARDNLIGVQFHPEKSQTRGLAFLAAFLAWRP